MNRRFKIAGLVSLLTLAAVLVYSAWTEKKNIKQYERLQAASPCDIGKPILFNSKGKPHIQFLIPKAYFYDLYRGYHDDKDPATLISLRVYKSDFSPDCGRSKEIHDNRMMWEKFVSMTVFPSGAGTFEKVLRHHKKWSSVFVKEFDNRFSVYRSQKTAQDGQLQATEDLLIPKDQNLEKTFFVECTHLLGPTPSEEWAGCGAYLYITDRVYVRYSIHNTDLTNYEMLNKKIQNFILGFIVNNNSEVTP